jgi:hypothetical protein
VQGGRELRDHIRRRNLLDVHTHWHIGDPDQHDIATVGQREVRASAANRRLPVGGAAGRAGFSNQPHRVGGDSQTSTQQHPHRHMGNDVAPTILEPTEGNRTLSFRCLEHARSETSRAFPLTQRVDEPQRHTSDVRHHVVNVRRHKKTVQKSVYVEIRLCSGAESRL